MNGGSMRARQVGRREPIFNIPPVVGALVGLLVVIHLGRLVLSEAADNDVLGYFAFAPGRYFGEPADYAPWPGGLAAQIWSPFTYALLHNDALHLISNSVVLAALGNVLARRTTGVRFLLFVIVMAPLSALGEMLIAAFQSAPVIGISGVICALMGGFARVMFPPESARVEPADPLWDDASWGETQPDAPSTHEPVSGRDRSERPISAARKPEFAPPVAAPILETLRRPRVIQFIAAFAILNLVLVFGAPILMGEGGAGVAWAVHVAGFVAGFLLWPRYDLVTA
jgi:membrane associated rhomboid family serine protease